MPRLFAVMRMRGPAYRADLPMEQQQAWDAHAALMDALTADGFIVLGGPLDEPDVLLIVRAESPEEVEARFAPDPWLKLDMLRPKWIRPWTLRLGNLL